MSKRRGWTALLADPVFLGACLLYALNRWFFLALAPGAPAFFRHHFNDLLLIPAALPLLLSLYAILRLRPDGRPPSPLEVTLHLVLWSILCEWIGPAYLHQGTGDPLDVMAYTLGAAIAGAYWYRKRKRQTAVDRDAPN